MQQVIVLSGPPGAGAAEVAAAICERFDRMVRIEADALRDWICAGYRRPWAGDAQAAGQARLAARAACAVAREAAAARYAAVICDAADPPLAELYREALSGAGAAAHLVTLLPGMDAASARPASGGPEAEARARGLHARLAAAARAGELPGAVLDTAADAGARVTADRVQELVARGEALLAPA